MSQEERRVPELRFKGFSDDWEQREFSEIFTKLKSYPLSRNVETATQTGTKYIHYGDIHTKKAQKINNESNIPYIEDKQYEILEKGDIILADASEDYQGIAEPSVIVEDTDFKIVAGLHTIALRTNKASPLYLYYLIKSSKFRRHGYRTGTGMKVFGITTNNVLQFQTYYPRLEEQMKISKTLDNLDQLITLHQRKNHILELLKKALVHHMLPKYLEKTPDIVFKNVNSHWKEAKAKELFSSITEKNQTELPVLSISQEEGVIHRKDVGKNIQYDPTTLKNYKVVRPGNFIISLRSFQGGFELSNISGITSPAYTVFALKNTSSNDINFWKTYFKSYKFIESLKTVTFGIRDGRSISYSDFGSLTLSYPSMKHEQYAIGLFFDKVDKVIKINQNKILKLQQLKVSYLHKMFL